MCKIAKNRWQDEKYKNAHIEALSKRVYQYDLEKTRLITIYKSAKEAKDKTGTRVSSCVSGRCKSAGGYFWSFTPLSLPKNSNNKKPTNLNQLHLF